MTTSDTDYVDDDRLPWLDTAEDDFEEGPSVLRIVLLVLLGLALIAGVIFAVWKLQGKEDVTGTGALINAQEGDYKVKPDQPGGMKVDGDTALATSQGGTAKAKVDTKAIPEVPVVGKTAPKPTATPMTGTSKVVVAVPPVAGSIQGKAPVTAPTAARTQPGGGGSVVQLGSFPTEAGANAAWAKLSSRFSYVAGLGKSVQAAQVNGRTTYRLRVNTGSTAQARDICDKLKVAGQQCFVPN